MYRLFTSESVTEGHPDKICDQISDAVLDAHLAIEPNSRVACETYVTTGLVVIGGEVTTSELAKSKIDVAEVARSVIERIGYTNSDYKFDAVSCGIINVMHSQSGDISRGVVTGGAGDQGMMFGYACDQTGEYMPLPIALAHRLTRRLAEVRKMKNSPMPYLRPDGKSQVTIAYHDGGRVTVDTVVVSTQHDPEPKGMTEKKWQDKIAADVKKFVINKVISEKLLMKDTKYYINPTGRFEIGGPHGDAGLTGRKIIVDTYGGYAPHGGGAFSGKDPSKVDRSAAYAARYLAKNIVAAGLAKECMIHSLMQSELPSPFPFWLIQKAQERVFRMLIWQKLLKELWISDLVESRNILTYAGRSSRKPRLTDISVETTKILHGRNWIS